MIWGVVWKLTQTDLDILDTYEGYPKSYQREVVNVNLVLDNKSKKKTLECIVYTFYVRVQCMIYHMVGN